MNRITTLLIAAVAVLAGCSRPGMKGDGVIKTTNHPIADFSALVVSGGYKITWSSGKPALTITTDQNLLPLIKATISGNTLQIDSEGTLAPTKGITIILSSTSLADVQLNGAVNLTASQLSGHGLKLESNGAADISVAGSGITQWRFVRRRDRHRGSQCLHFRSRRAHLFRQPKIGGAER